MVLYIEFDGYLKRKQQQPAVALPMQPGTSALITVYGFNKYFSISSSNMSELNCFFKVTFLKATYNM